MNSNGRAPSLQILRGGEANTLDLVGSLGDVLVEISKTWETLQRYGKMGPARLEPGALQIVMEPLGALRLVGAGKDLAFVPDGANGHSWSEERAESVRQVFGRLVMECLRESTLPVVDVGEGVPEATLGGAAGIVVPEADVEAEADVEEAAEAEAAATAQMAREMGPPLDGAGFAEVSSQAHEEATRIKVKPNPSAEETGWPGTSEVARRVEALYSQIKGGRS